MRIHPLMLLAVLSISALAQTTPAVPSTTASSATAQALPEPSALIARLRANEKAVQQLRRNYVCNVSVEEVELNKDGSEGKHHHNEMEIYWKGKLQISRLLVKDGKPLSKEDLAKEDEKIQKALSKTEEKDAKVEDKKKDSGPLSIVTFLRTSTFSDLHREDYKGHQVLVMKLDPNPSYEPHGESETIAHMLEGRVWIDEQAAQIVRLEARLSKKLKIAGGLAANIRQGSGAVLEKARINDEIWLPSYSDINIDGHVLLFASIRRHITESYNNYRKFRTESRILSPEDEPSADGANAAAAKDAIPAPSK